MTAPRGRRFGRATAAAVLGSMLVFGALGGNPASADLQSFTTSASGFAVRVIMDLSGLPASVKTAIDGPGGAWQQARAALPSEAQSKVPAQFPFVIDQTFVKSLSDASSTVNKAVSVLGEGFQDLGAKTAETVGQTEQSNVADVMIPNDPSLKIVQATGGILRSAVAAGPKVDGDATLATVTATLQNVASLLPEQLRTAFGDLVTQLNATITSTTTTVQNTVNTVETTLIGALPAPVQQVLPVQAINDLSSAIALPAVPNPLTVSLADIKGVANKTTAEKTAAGLSSSDASSSITSVSLLGGFVTVGAVNLSSHSEAGGTPGSAKNVSACSLADVRIGGGTGVSLDGKNLYVSVNGQPVAVPVVGDTVGQLKAQVDSLLAAAGVSVALCDAATSSASPDGTSANQSVSAFKITYAPKAPAAISALGINAGDTLAKITIDPTVQTSATAQLPAPAGTPLPRTGAPMAATVIVGFAIFGGAILMRRYARR